MKLNHLDLPVLDVQAAVAFFERYFDFELRTSRNSPALAVLDDRHGFTLVLERTEQAPLYPGSFHVGFLLDDVALVHAFHARAKQDGLDVSDVQTNNRGTLSYCRTPHGFLLEVSCQRPLRPTAGG